MRSPNFNRLCSDCQLEEPTEQIRMLSGLVTSGLLCFNCWLRGPVAQRLEQGTHNPLVPGSNPGGPKFHFRFLIFDLRLSMSCNESRALL